MPRPLKPNHPITVRMDQTVYDKLNQFCADAGQPKTIAIERALEMYIDDYYRKQQIIESSSSTDTK